MINMSARPKRKLCNTTNSNTAQSSSNSSELVTKSLPSKKSKQSTASTPCVPVNSVLLGDGQKNTEENKAAKKSKARKETNASETTSSVELCSVSVPSSSCSKLKCSAYSEPAVNGITSDQLVSQPGMKRRLLTADFDKPCIELGRYLLGKLLVANFPGSGRISGRIVETESYLGGDDKASHSYGGKRTERTEAMYMQPGTSYVYNIYGVYSCINISSRGDGAAVLIRSLEPVEGVEQMKAVRAGNSKSVDSGNKLKPHQLCNGPSKLTQALGITKTNANQVDLATCASVWVEDADPVESVVIESARIGIGNYAEEWTSKPLRFYIKGNKCVSVVDKKAEL